MSSQFRATGSKIVCPRHLDGRNRGNFRGDVEFPGRKILNVTYQSHGRQVAVRNPCVGSRGSDDRMRKGEKGEWKGDQIRYREEQIFSEKAQSMQDCSIFCPCGYLDLCCDRSASDHIGKIDCPCLGKLIERRGEAASIHHLQTNTTN